MATAKSRGEIMDFKGLAIKADQIIDAAGVAIDTTELSAITGEATLLDGASATAPAAGKAAILDSAGALRTAENVGTAGTGVTAIEYGDGYMHTTVLTVAGVLPAIAGGAALGVGLQVYTLPAGVQVVDAAHMSIAITQTEGNITADTPEVGLGSVVAAGVVAVLSTPATFEDFVTGQVAADSNGTATVKATVPTAGAGLVTEAAGSKAVFLNVADTWAASGDLAATVTGTIVLTWRHLA